MTNDEKMEIIKKLYNQTSEQLRFFLELNMPTEQYFDAQIQLSSALLSGLKYIIHTDIDDEPKFTLKEIDNRVLCSELTRVIYINLTNEHPDKNQAVCNIQNAIRELIWGIKE